MHCYVGARVDGVIGCVIAIPSHDILSVCAFIHMTYNVFDLVLTVFSHTSLCEPPVLAKGVVINFAS